MLPDIPRLKGNHSMKFGQLIILSWKKTYTKYVGETNPDLTQWNLYDFLLLYVQVED